MQPKTILLKQQYKKETNRYYIEMICAVPAPWEWPPTVILFQLIFEPE
jgi:hypothetical protein